MNLAAQSRVAVKPLSVTRACAVVAPHSQLLRGMDTAALAGACLREFRRLQPALPPRVQKFRYGSDEACVRALAAADLA